MTFTHFHLCLHGNLHMQKDKCKWECTAEIHNNIDFEPFPPSETAKDGVLKLELKHAALKGSMYTQSLYVLCFTCLHKTNLTAKIGILGVDTIQVLPNFVIKLWPTLGKWVRKKKMWSRRTFLWSYVCNLCFSLVPPNSSFLNLSQNSCCLSMDSICSIPFYWAARSI